MSRIAVVLLVAAGASFAHAAPIERVAAVVDDALVLESELDDRAATHKDVAATTARTVALDELIDARLIEATCAARGVRVSEDEIDHAVNLVQKQNKLTVIEFSKALLQQGYDTPSYRRAIADMIRKARLMTVLTTGTESEREAQFAAWLAERRRHAYLDRRALSGDRKKTIEWAERELSSIAGDSYAKLALPSALHVGAKLDPGLVQHALRAVWATELFDDVRFELDDGGVLRIVTKPLPVLHDVIVQGEPTPKELAGVAGYAVHPARFFAALEGYRRAEQRRGYYWFEVSETLRPAGPDAVDVVVTMNRGPRAIVDVRFTRNVHLDRAALAAALVYSPEELLDVEYRDTQAQLLQLVYADRGFIKARVEAKAMPAVDRRSVTVELTVDEGPRHTLDRVAVRGEALASEAASLAALNLPRGSVFSRVGVFEAVARLQRAVEAAGLGYLAVEIESEVDGTSIGLTFDVHRVAAPRMGKIDIMGRPGGACQPAKLAAQLEAYSDEPFTAARLATIRSTIETSCRVILYGRNFDETQHAMRFYVAAR